MQNLENEVSTMLKIDIPKDQEILDETESMIDECFSKIKYRLNIISDNIREMLEKADKTEVDFGNGSSATKEDIVVTLVSTSFLNLFSKLSLNCNCNLCTSKVLLRRLAFSTESESSVQGLYTALIEKTILFDE